MERDVIEVTSERYTPNERWRYTDRQGHEHYYDHGYPTLDLVIDSEHWCDGSEGWAHHDPHMAVDESHHECKVCREVIEPKLDAPGTRKSIAGMTTVTVEVSDGQRESTFVLSGDDLFDELRTAPGPSEAFAILDASDNATEVYSSYRS